MNRKITRRALLGGAAALTARGPAAESGPARLVHVKGEKVSFHSGERLLFEYRYAAARPKTYVHPLCAPNGVPLTLDGPEDHIHHRGLMLAWSDVKGFDFWGEDNPGPPHGRIVHQRFETIREKPPEVVGLNHWIAGGEVLVIERQTIRAPEPSPDLVWLEWESRLSAGANPVTLSAAKHPYNGLGIRFVRSMDLGGVLNSNGTNTIEKANGEPAAWLAYDGAVEGGQAGVAVFDHPANPRHPTPFFVMHRPFGYLSAAPTFREPFHLEPGRPPLRLRYAVVTFPGAAEREKLDRLYQRWTARSRS